MSRGVIAALRQRVTALKNASAELIDETQELTAQLEQARELSDNLTSFRQVLKELIKLRLAATAPIPDRPVLEEEEPIGLGIGNLPPTLAALASVSSTTPLSLMDTILPGPDATLPLPSPRTPIVRTNIQEPELAPEPSAVNISPPPASVPVDEQDFAPAPPAPEFDMPGFGAPVDASSADTSSKEKFKGKQVPIAKTIRPVVSSSLQEQLLNRPQLKRINRDEIDATRANTTDSAAPIQLLDAVKQIILQRSESLKGNVQIGTVLQEQEETLPNGDVRKRYVSVNKDTLKLEQGRYDQRKIDPDAFDETTTEVWIPNSPVPYAPKRSFKLPVAGQGKPNVQTPTPALLNVVQRAQETSALELKRKATAGATTGATSFTTLAPPAKKPVSPPGATTAINMEQKSRYGPRSQTLGTTFGNMLKPAENRSIPKPKQTSIFDSQTETDEKAAGLFSGMKRPIQPETKVTRGATKSSNTKVLGRLNTATMALQTSQPLTSVRDEAQLIVYKETLDNVYSDLGRIANLDKEIAQLDAKILLGSRQVELSTDYDFQMLLAMEHLQYDERRASLVQVRRDYARHIGQISREIPTWLNAILKDYSPLYSALVK